MCVILQIESGATIPADKLERACDINPDGYGLAYVTGSEIKIIRSIKVPNDPKEISEHLTKLNKHRVFLHLRYATVGEVSEENNHPFVILRQRQAPVACFMHNGTISSFSPSGVKPVHSDTFLYARDLVSPLAERTAAFLSAKKVLPDEFFQQVVSKPAGMSVIVFFDRWGRVLKVNENKGKQFEGWWASNDYSFDNQHHRSSAKTAWTNTTRSHGFNQRSYYRRNSGLLVPWEADDYPDINEQMASWEKELDSSVPFVKDKLHLIDASVPYTRSGSTALLNEIAQLSVHLKSREGKTMTEVNRVPTIRNLRIKRKTFCEMAGLKDLSDLGNFSADDLEKFSKQYPVATSQLIIDLYNEFAKLRICNLQQASTIKTQAEKLAALRTTTAEQAEQVK